MNFYQVTTNFSTLTLSTYWSFSTELQAVGEAVQQGTGVGYGGTAAAHDLRETPSLGGHHVQEVLEATAERQVRDCAHVGLGGGGGGGGGGGMRRGQWESCRLTLALINQGDHQWQI